MNNDDSGTLAPPDDIDREEQEVATRSALVLDEWPRGVD